MVRTAFVQRIIFWLFTLSFMPSLIHAQKIEDLENLDLSKLKGQLKEGIKKYKDASLFEVSGGLSVNTVLTALTEGENTQPFSFVATGNLMFTIKGYKLPFSFTYSNWKFSNTNPSFRFNRFSFKPKIPKLGLNMIIGDGNMTFSPYTLNGFQFFGLGGERTFGKFRVQAMAGRFMLAVPEDSTNRVTPSYRRLGAGLKVGYVNDKYKIGAAAFYASDDKTSIPLLQKESSQFIRPRENLAISVEGGFPIAEHLTWEGEFAASIVTENSASDDTEGMSQNPLVKLLKSSNVTSRVYPAMKSNINYIIGQDGLIGLGYERVAPNYNTLGAYYFTNDFENVTVNAQHRGKVNVGLNTGMQYDNLNNKKGSSSGRMVLSTNLGFEIIENMNFTMNYSNFQSFTFVRTGFELINRVTQFENIDTLNFSLLSQNAAVTVNYAMTKDTARPQTFGLNLNYMESDSKRSGTTTTTQSIPINQLNNGSKFLNGAVNYSLGLTQKDLVVAVGVNLSYNYGGSTKTITTGPLVTVIKNLLDKTVQTSGTIAYNVSQTDDIQQHVLILNAGVNTAIKKQHNVSFNLLGQNRFGTLMPSTWVLSATIGYNYTFEKKFKKIYNPIVK